MVVNSVISSDIPLSLDDLFDQIIQNNMYIPMILHEMIKPAKKVLDPKIRIQREEEVRIRLIIDMFNEIAFYVEDIIHDFESEIMQKTYQIMKTINKTKQAIVIS